LEPEPSLAGGRRGRSRLKYDGTAGLRSHDGLLELFTDTPGSLPYPAEEFNDDIRHYIQILDNYGTLIH
jgi:hypothetical protein